MTPAAVFAVAFQLVMEKETMDAAQVIAVEGVTPARHAKNVKRESIKRRRGYMAHDLQSFLKNMAVAALTDRFVHPGSEHLKQAFAAGDAMVRLLAQVHDYMQKNDPKEAKEFERAARRVVEDYREHAARYLETRGSWKT